MSEHKDIDDALMNVHDAGMDVDCPLSAKEQGRLRFLLKELRRRRDAEESPDPRLIESMAMRYDHGFGLMDELMKEFIRTTMRQLWEEVVGKGFYRPLPPPPGEEGREA